MAAWERHAEEEHAGVQHNIPYGDLTPTLTCMAESCKQTFSDGYDSETYKKHEQENPNHKVHPLYNTELTCSCGKFSSRNDDELSAHTDSGESGDSTSATYQAITASEPVEEVVYRCSCGDVFYSRSQAERHAASAGPGNPPYPYTSDRRQVEKEVTVTDRKPTDQMVCTTCGETRAA